MTLTYLAGLVAQAQAVVNLGMSGALGHGMSGSNAPKAPLPGIPLRPVGIGHM